jgi:hypothetical protein
MTKVIIRLTVLFLATVGFNSAVAQSDFPLRCRGPLNYAVGTGEVVFFAKNSSRAGEGGISLQPGTCAWNDRPMASGDPSKIYVQPETSTKVYPAFTAFAACAGNPRCVVEFLAHNANTPSDPHFQVEDSYLRVYYPNFP